MMNKQLDQSRRRFLQALALSVSGLTLPLCSYSNTQSLITRPVPSSNEPIPAIGLGSSLTFNVGNDQAGLDNVAEIMRHFFNAGGRLIDSSPMYGSSQQAIGYGLVKLGKTADVFAAEKVWTWDRGAGPAQMEQSRQHWRIDGFDLMQVHNLVAWETHLKTLYTMKQLGKIRYVGITTSHGRRHDELETIMLTQPLDFVQLSYNILDREVEQRLLPLAMKRGIAVIVNRPFQRGDLIHALQGKPLPPWASTIDCTGWPQFLLKFIVSHPAVTCVIPATTNTEHVKENMTACYGALPDQAMRTRMIEYVNKLIR